jgi:hypothetical protein
MKAIIRDFTGDPWGPGVVVAEVTIGVGDSVAMVESKNEWLKTELMSEGIVGEMGKTFMPQDGVKFIEQMPFHFDSAYMRAEVVPD